MSSKTFFTVLGRLPLLFVVDSILRGTFLDFTFFGSQEGGGILLQSTTAESDNPNDENLIHQVLWTILLFWVTLLSLVLVCTPINFILDFYRWVTGAALIWFSYDCNKKYVQRVLASVLENETAQNVTEATGRVKVSPSLMLFSINLLVQMFISLAFDQISLTRLLHKNSRWFVYSRYPVDILLFMSFSLPVFLESFLVHNSAFAISVSLSVIFPLLALAVHLCFVIFKVSQEVVLPGVLQIKTEIREIGLDGLLMSMIEKANLSWLLRLFFVTRVIYLIVSSKLLQDLDNATHNGWTDVEVWKSLAQEILYNMCGTLISIMSLASIITIISGWSLSCVYKVIQAYDEEGSLQPVVSGFLFVLLAMQTGITGIPGDLRLQLLFQNSILLVVANQHFVHNVATDLLLKASTDDTTLEKHIRPLIPFVFFFTFPFVAVMPLWGYPFRISWLLAVTVFCIELIIKSISTIIIYTINMLHIHTEMFSEDADNLIFYIKGVCGCLEFICGVFLFLNGAYIFIYESGGFIRLFMMTIHFYCNIYQSAVKGWEMYKLRLSSWEKVNNLEAAKQEQLDENDICSICYQDMKDAVVLDCSHIFHKSCLQKWLSIKETCPLCHLELKKAHGNNETAVER